MSNFDRSRPTKRFHGSTFIGRETQQPVKESSDKDEDINRSCRGKEFTTENTEFLQNNSKEKLRNESLSPPSLKFNLYGHSFSNHHQSSTNKSAVNNTTQVSYPFELPVLIKNVLSPSIVSETKDKYESSKDSHKNRDIENNCSYDSYETSTYKNPLVHPPIIKINNQSRNKQDEECYNTNIFHKIDENSQSLSDNSTKYQTYNVVDSDIENLNDVSFESKVLQTKPSLREFDTLDEFEESQEQGDTLEPNSSESDMEHSEELSIDDINEVLDEQLPEKLKNSNKSEHLDKLKHKVVLEEIGHDHFDLLPEGWMKIYHASGMPVYLHKKSRVCTMARPYFLGHDSSRNHNLPLSAVPCLQYRRASELEKKNRAEREKKLKSQNPQTMSELELMSAKVETFKENKVAQSLEVSELHEYCKKAFNFKTVTILPSKSSKGRMKYARTTKYPQKKQRPTLPSETKLLKFPIWNPDGSTLSSSGEWILNPNGKSSVCILHEYVQHALKKHPNYQFEELENPATPYSATVIIDDVNYGFGKGVSKEQAKVEAAKAALEILIPEMKYQIDGEFGMSSGNTKTSDESYVSLFNLIKIEDPRVYKLCVKSTEPPPYAILMTCLNRNTGIGGIKVDYKVNKHFERDVFTMIVGNHKASVPCKNRLEGKQRASQAILKALHPNIEYWSSLLRMYGNRSIKSFKEKKQKEKEITELQRCTSVNQPNFAVLDKLKIELLKLKAKREATKSKGKFVIPVPEDIILPSLSSTNKVNLSKEYR